jgi:hypothetical protein
VSNSYNKLAIACLCAAIYLCGAYGCTHGSSPTPDLSAKKPKSAGNKSPGAHDEYGRYTLLTGKKEIACPTQTDRTVVALVFGQSNSANMYGQRTLQSSREIINFFDDKCYIASDPLLGASGRAGSVWTLTGTKLLGTGKYDRIIFVPSGIGASQISRWAPGGDLNPMLADVIRGATRQYRFTHVIFHQGESDAQKKTSKDGYKRSFLSMVQSIRDLGVDAPFYVSVASICAPFYNANNPVTKAQRELVSVPQRILPGPNTDVLNAAEDRFDDCHMSYAGAQKFSDLLMETVFR